jgi:hypothetical protein
MAQEMLTGCIFSFCLLYRPRKPFVNDFHSRKGRLGKQIRPGVWTRAGAAGMVDLP